MREKYRKSIVSLNKFPQFTTMNVIDGQAGLISYASLIFYSLTIDNILNIIVLLILAGVTIATLIGDNGLLSKTSEAKNANEIGKEKEQISLVMTNMKLEKEEDEEKREQIFQGHMDEYAGEGKTKVYNAGNSYIIYFLETNRVYTVEENGNITEEDTSIIKEDTIAGAFDGAGTEENPYIIMSIEDLAYFANQINSGQKTYRNTWIKLGKTLDFKSNLSYKDVNTTYKYDEETNSYIVDENSQTTLKELCTTGIGFIPIGNLNKKFSGKLLGENEKGYSLKNIYQNVENHAGLFYNGDAIIKNLTITGIIKCKGNSCGGIGAEGSALTVENCINYCDISNTGMYTGGISGYGGNIKNCKNYGNINATGDHVGGIVGRAASMCTDNFNYGMITAKGNYTGGILGSNASTQAIRCINYGVIQSEGNYVGGISGSVSGRECINYGDIQGKNYVGGITGWSGASNSCNYGDITATENTAGGIGGTITNDRPIINCYNIGKIKAPQNVAEIIGNCQYASNENSTYSKIINCYGIGTLTGNSNIGGIVGTKSNYGIHYIDYCYYPKNFGVEVVGKVSYGTLTITNCDTQYSLEQMKTPDFINTLNNYVDKYNQGDKAETSGEELLRWVQDKESGYPKLDFK